MKANSYKQINLKNMAIVPLQYYMKWFDDTFSMWMHHHNYFEIMYASSGSFTVETASDENLTDLEEHIISQGQFILIKPNFYHILKMNKGQKAFIYNMEFLTTDLNHEMISSIRKVMNIDFDKLFNETKLSNIIKSPDGYILSNDTSQIGTTLKELILILENKNKTIENNLQIIIKEISLFIEISNCISNKTIGAISYIRKVNSYIMENYQKNDISISEIAAYINISKSYLEHQYKKQMGQTIWSFINVLRVQKAKKLLYSTSYQISKIATEVGFKDKNQLNYEFKKMIGLTPSNFRKSNVEEKVDYQDYNYKSYAIEPK